MNKRHPISKAVRNSLMMNEGITTCMGTSRAFLGFGVFDILINNARSSVLVCRSIKPFINSAALELEASKSNSSARYGLTACSFMPLKVGAIVNSVKNNASPMIAMFGGIVCVLKALRINDRTITIRVNDVIMTRRLGNMARPPKIMTSFTGVLQSLPLPSSSVALFTTSARSPMLGRLVRA